MKHRRFSTNPQAMAAAAVRRTYTGDPQLAIHVDVDPDTWLTPRFILDQLGAFDLDPCAAAENPDWVAAGSRFTRAENGLEAEWHGRVFMNPPYSDTARWLRKHGEHRLGISLVPATVESIVWRDVVWPRACAILLLHGRTRFANPDGSLTTGRPLRSIALIAWASADAGVLRRASFAGVLLEGWRQQ